MAGYVLRKASLDELHALETLIARSIRHLGAADYTQDQIELALKGAFGVDTQLIRDGTYFVAVAGNELVGCGGWSWRRTLFGGDARAERDEGELDPAVDAAKIRAFFVDPVWARRGIGRAILAQCEADALAAGFNRAELMATLPGARLYSAYGYIADAPIQHSLAPDFYIEFVPMRKILKSGP